MPENPYISPEADEERLNKLSSFVLEDPVVTWWDRVTITLVGIAVGVPLVWLGVSGPWVPLSILPIALAATLFRRWYLRRR